MNNQILENVLTAVFECGYGDLYMLDNCYSDLANEIIDMDDILSDAKENETLNLNYILYEAYYQIADRIIDDAIELLTKEYNNEIAEELELDDEIKEKIVEELTEMSNSPFCNFIDTHFNNHLDQTIDWDKNVTYNVFELIKYIKEGVI